MWHMDDTGGDTPAIVDPDTWQPILTWLGEAGMKLLAKGNRLSIMPVAEEHWQFILSLE